MKDVEDLGLDDSLIPRTHEDYVLAEIEGNTKIAEKYGGIERVHIGEIIGRREIYKELCIYATVHHIEQLPDGNCKSGVKEGHLKCSNLLELATVARSLSVGKTLIISRDTLEILEVRTW